MIFVTSIPYIFAKIKADVIMDILKCYKPWKHYANMFLEKD